MQKLGLNEIREKFLAFYESKGHFRRGSFSLIPESDKSLLIINSGMAPLKPYFSGQSTPPAKRMVTCQKCVRTADIENVGITSRHGTFFEMLGSFSFGDYFKRESIKWGWEFMTDVLKLPKDRLWISVYEEDDDAYDIWTKEIGFPQERIVRLGKEDNFWEIGVGPCGPCSEIYFDRGEAFGCDNKECKPGCECDRFVEFWNHVFTGFTRQEDGSYEKLKNPNIDTGMGLERIACIMQGVDSIFEVDTIKRVLDEVCSAAGKKYQAGDEDVDISIRIITDHIRSATFMISDKIMPSNEGRGYVLRRLIRRAVRHGKKIGIEKENFLSGLARTVIETSKDAYPELEVRNEYIKTIIANEEQRFEQTLTQGLELIEEYIDSMKQKNQNLFSGDRAFKLHDTYGFPFEITMEIMKERGFEVDEQGFRDCMQRQKDAGKAAISQQDEAWKDDGIDVGKFQPTVFTGYDSTEMKAKIIALEEGENHVVILDKSAFYPTGGGQLCDTGSLENENCVADVLEVIKKNDVLIHKVKIISGKLSTGDEVVGKVDVVKRNNSARNHSCTHILHQALRDVVGEHVSQAGSMVSSDTLRFDFSHFKALTEKEIAEIERTVNEKIDMFLDVDKEEMRLEDAKKIGAIGIFDDKYEEYVRVVKIGDYSKELCGGIHIDNSGQIGSFKILSETGIAAGVRRIEAITSRGISERYVSQQNSIKEMSLLLKTDSAEIIQKINNIIKEKEVLTSELESYKEKGMQEEAAAILKNAEKIGDRLLVTKYFEEKNNKDVMLIADKLKEMEKDLIVVLAGSYQGKNTILITAGDEVIKDGFHSGKMVKKIAESIGGRGGGKPQTAQAGIPDIDRIEEAFALAKKFLN